MEDISITEAAEAIGIQCIVIDEDTDFDKLPSLYQLMGFKNSDDYLADCELRKQESLEQFRMEAKAILEDNHGADNR